MRRFHFLPISRMRVCGKQWIAAEGNALRLTPSGGSVQVRVEDHGASVSIAVVDTGPGIAPQDQRQTDFMFSVGIGIRP